MVTYVVKFQNLSVKLIIEIDNKSTKFSKFTHPKIIYILH